MRAANAGNSLCFDEIDRLIRACSKSISPALAALASCATIIIPD
jgi:hypothetical protein